MRPVTAVWPQWGGKNRGDKAVTPQIDTAQYRRMSRSNKEVHKDFIVNYQVEQVVPFAVASRLDMHSRAQHTQLLTQQQ